MTGAAPTDVRGLPLRVWSAGRDDHLYRDCIRLRRAAAVYRRSRAGLGAALPKICVDCLRRWPAPGPIA